MHLTFISFVYTHIYQLCNHLTFISFVYISHLSALYTSHIYQLCIHLTFISFVYTHIYQLCNHLTFISFVYISHLSALYASHIYQLCIHLTFLSFVYTSHLSALYTSYIYRLYDLLYFKIFGCLIDQLFYWSAIPILWICLLHLSAVIPSLSDSTAVWQCFYLNCLLPYDLFYGIFGTASEAYIILVLV